MMNKMRNNRGRGAGLALILMLVVALLVAWLAMQNMSSLGIGGAPAQQEQSQDKGGDAQDGNAQEKKDPVDKAQDAVDQMNDKTQDAENAMDKSM
jgi:predicted metalloprotease